MAVRIECELREPGAELQRCDYIEFEWSTNAGGAVGNALHALTERLRESGKKLSSDDENAFREALRPWLAKHRQEIGNGELVRQHRPFLYSCLKPLESLEDPEVVIRSRPVRGTRPRSPRPSTREPQQGLGKKKRG